MKMTAVIASVLASLPAAALAAAAEPLPEPRVGPLVDRVLFLILLWLMIGVVVWILRKNIEVVDSLHAMGYTRFPEQTREGGKCDGHSHVDGDRRS